MPGPSEGWGPHGESYPHFSPSLEHPSPASGRFAGHVSVDGDAVTSVRARQFHERTTLASAAKAGSQLQTPSA